MAFIIAQFLHQQSSYGSRPLSSRGCVLLEFTTQGNMQIMHCLGVIDAVAVQLENLCHEIGRALCNKTHEPHLAIQA